jgi:hypothetical protein
LGFLFNQLTLIIEVDFERRLASLERKQAITTSDVSDLQKTVKAHGKRIDENYKSLVQAEDYSRSVNIRVKNFPKLPGAETHVRLAKDFADKINDSCMPQKYKLDPLRISAIHRLQDGKELFIRFMSKEDCDVVNRNKHRIAQYVAKNPNFPKLDIRKDHPQALVHHVGYLTKVARKITDPKGPIKLDRKDVSCDKKAVPPTITIKGATYTSLTIPDQYTQITGLGAFNQGAGSMGPPSSNAAPSNAASSSADSGHLHFIGTTVVDSTGTVTTRPPNTS